VLTLRRASRWAACCALWTLEATRAQTAPDVDSDLRAQANAVLTVMSYQVIPDATASALSISNVDAGNPGLVVSQLGGGFTWPGRSLYLEGVLAASRYDPDFIAHLGNTTLTIPVKWDGVTATGGIGWDFKLAPKVTLRPIFNLVIGHIASELQFAVRLP